MIDKIVTSFVQDTREMGRTAKAALVAYLILGMASGLTALILALAAPQPYQPLVRFVESAVTPERAEYCPGEVMTFSYHWEAQHTPAVIRVYTTFYSIDRHETVFPANSRDAPVFILTDPGAFFPQTRSVEIPALPPGKYEHRRAIVTNYTESSAIVIPFTIPTDCK